MAEHNNKRKRTLTAIYNKIMKYRYYIVDAFTDQPFGGNPAGVVLLGKGESFPSEELMQHIAAELRYSETAFVQPQSATEYTTRYFTPLSEVDLCGHATIATFGVLRHEGVASDGNCLNHTLAGDLTVTVGEKLMMQMAKPKQIASIDQPDELERLCHIMTARIPSMPVAIVTAGLPDIILPVEGLKELNALHPDMEALADFSREKKVVGVHAFALTHDPADSSTAHVRNFAPLYGVNEESATGTANAALLHYLHLNGIVSAPSECSFVQGEAMRRPSIVSAKLGPDGGIFVGGQCRILAKGDLLV